MWCFTAQYLLTQLESESITLATDGRWKLECIGVLGRSRGCEKHAATCRSGFAVQDMLLAIDEYYGKRLVLIGFIAWTKRIQCEH